MHTFFSSFMVFFLAVLQQMARVICMTRMIQFHRYSRIQTFEFWELQREIIVVRNRYVLNLLHFSCGFFYSN